MGLPSNNELERLKKSQRKYHKKHSEILERMDDEKIPSTEDIVKDMKKNPETWVFMPPGKYKEELEMKEQISMPIEEKYRYVETEETAVENREIVFQKEPQTWIMKLTPEGIKFNHDDYSNLTENEFAENIIQILEKGYDVIFIKKD